MRIPAFYLLTLLATPCISAFAQNARKAKIDSLEKVVASTKEDTTKAESLCELCWELRLAGQPDAALEKGEAGIKLARAAGFKRREAFCLNIVGVTYWSQGDHDRALDYYQKGLKIRVKIGDRGGQAILLNNIGNVYDDQGAYAFALDYYQKSLKIRAEIGDRGGQANVLNNIGVIYYRQGAYERALDYFQKSLSIQAEIGNREREAALLGNIGSIYHKQGDFDSALDSYQKSLEIREEIGDVHGEATALANIGVIYKSQGDYARALDYHRKSLEIRDETGNQNGAAYSLCKIAWLLIKTNQAAEGRRLATRALNIAAEIGALRRMQLAAQVHAQADSALGDWKSAYERHKLYKQYSDSLKNDAQSQEIGRLEAKYNFDKQIEQREREEAAAAERREIYIWIAACGFAALALVAGLFGWGYRTKRSANKQLALQNEEIRQQREELDAALDELRELSQFKENMTGMLVHDLKNPLSVVIGRAELLKDPQLKSAAQQMNGLTMNMLDVQKFESAGVNLELRPAPARQIAAAALEQVAFLAEEKNIALHNDANPHLYLLADESYMVRVLVNLLNNAVKFTPYGGTIRVSATESESGFAELAVTDSGAGIPEDKLDAVFDKFSKLEDKTGLNKQGTGLGLTFCKLAAEAHGGHIRAENAPEGGARFRLTLPRADAPAGSLTVKTGEPEPACAPRELTAADKAALAPVLAAIRRYEIYEMSEIASALEALDENASPALAAWRRRLEGALYELDEQAFTAVLREAEA